MMRRDYEIYEELRDVLREMDEDEYVDAIIVEGKNDKRALEEMGVVKHIAMYPGARCSYDMFIEHMKKYKCVVILTDYDRKGKYFHRKLSKRLEREGIRIENRYRDRIGEIFGEKGMRTIESMRSLMRRFE
ncbi:MAG: toprim domain-containing protein [Canidatus Methanoxibalbensis ujae]|nr:toprim domain-containing protein [Candidatus Methanoxibalbensis ujae]MCW7078872.1 toprim domain-containing protein [Candidatus Methanoxibalbensis ujae]RLG39344.1 MAG: hypothetical protein DRN79_00045 [Methanosarcinales archaeon]